MASVEEMAGSWVPSGGEISDDSSGEVQSADNATVPAQVEDLLREDPDLSGLDDVDTQATQASSLNDVDLASKLRSTETDLTAEDDNTSVVSEGYSTDRPAFDDGESSDSDLDAPESLSQRRKKGGLKMPTKAEKNAIKAGAAIDDPTKSTPYQAHHSTARALAYLGFKRGEDLLKYYLSLEYLLAYETFRKISPKGNIPNLKNLWATYEGWDTNPGSFPATLAEAKEKYLSKDGDGQLSTLNRDLMLAYLQLWMADRAHSEVQSLSLEDREQTAKDLKQRLKKYGKTPELTLDNVPQPKWTCRHDKHELAEKINRAFTALKLVQRLINYGQNKTDKSKEEKWANLFGGNGLRECNLQSPRKYWLPVWMRGPATDTQQFASAAENLALARNHGSPPKKLALHWRGRRINLKVVEKDYGAEIRELLEEVFDVDPPVADATLDSDPNFVKSAEEFRDLVRYKLDIRKGTKLYQLFLRDNVGDPDDQQLQLVWSSEGGVYVPSWEEFCEQVREFEKPTLDYTMSCFSEDEKDLNDYECLNKSIAAQVEAHNEQGKSSDEGFPDWSNRY